MNIIPNRTMSLDGQHVEQGRAVEVSEAAGIYALRMGWASPVESSVAEAQLPKAIRSARNKSKAD